MSYEGYDKVLCENGHVNHWNSHDEENPVGFYGSDEKRAKCCPDCGGRFVWYCSVDQTNCDIDEKTGLEPGDVELVLLEEAKFETCPCCNHSKLISEEVYQIPHPEKGCHILAEDTMFLLWWWKGVKHFVSEDSLMDWVASKEGIKVLKGHSLEVYKWIKGSERWDPGELVLYETF